MSRINDAKKNVSWEFMSNAVSSLLHFLNRTVFIYTIGELYLGVNGLFTNIISLLSLTELGIGTAISFSLYKPLANKDNEKIKSLMAFYKLSYRLIAAVVFMIGIILMPFLKYIIKGGENIENIHFIFFIFLITTVFSYLITYKQVLIEADQKKHLIASWQLFFNVATFVLQFVLLLVFRSYYVYLVATLLINIFRYVFINIKITGYYPLLKQKEYVPLSEDEKNTIFTKVKALILHNVGQVCVNQTDNIIISAFIDIITVGLVSNYFLITNAIKGIFISVFTAVASSLGNLLATEDETKVLKIFNAYNYIAFLLYSWVSIALWFLMDPFISLWIGDRMLITSSAVYLMIINFYFEGMLLPLTNLKSVAGLFEQDRWVPVAQAITNLVVSIVCVQYFGLTGVYIGTFVSALFPCIYRPIIVYKYVFHVSVFQYYKRYIEYILIMTGEVIALRFIRDCFALKADNFLIWGVYAIGLSLICCAINVLFFIRTDETKYIYSTAKRAISRSM